MLLLLLLLLLPVATATAAAAAAAEVTAAAAIAAAETAPAAVAAVADRKRGRQVWRLRSPTAAHSTPAAKARSGGCQGPNWRCHLLHIAAWS